jgi:hypothetical protein
MGRPITTCQCGECEKCKHREYMREYYHRTHKTYENIEKRNTRMLAAYHADKTKYRARMMVYSRVEHGTIIQEPCSLCGSTPVAGHHNDYSEPLEVVWLCRACHDMVHNSISCH